MYCTRVLLGGVSAGGVCAQCLSFCCLEHTWLQVKYAMEYHLKTLLSNRRENHGASFQSGTVKLRKELIVVRIA